MIISRWMIRRDMSQVLPLLGVDEETIVKMLRQRNNIGRVCTEEQGSDERITAACIYELREKSLFVSLINAESQASFNVIVDELLKKLSPTRRNSCWFQVPDDKLYMHIWLRDLGIKAVSVTEKDYLFRTLKLQEVTA